MKIKNYCLKIIFAMLLCILIFFNLNISSSALDSTVTYDGNAKNFVFIPNSTDLFQNFKGVLPGDSIDQKIVIQNPSSNKYEVEVYLKAKEVDKADVDFLSKLNLKIKSNGNTIFDDSAHKQGSLTNNISLGKLKPSETAQVVVTLQVPNTLENDFAGKKGNINWLFSVEEFSDSSNNSSSNGSDPNFFDKWHLPKTGEDIAKLLFVIGALIVSGALIYLLTKKHKKSEK